MKKYGLILIISLLLSPIIVSAEYEGPPADTVPLVMGAQHMLILKQLGKPVGKTRHTNGVTWMYTKPKLTLFFDNTGHLKGWIQNHQ